MNAELINPARLLSATAAMPTAGTGTGLLARLADWLARERRYRATARELASLSDRELDDVGLSRGDIERVARLSARVA